MVPVLQALTGIVQFLGAELGGTTEQGRKLIASVAAGTVGLIAFAGAMALVEAGASGGIMPVIGAVVGALGGFALASGALTPIFDTLKGVLSGVLDAVGGALERVAAVAADVLPALADGFKFAASVAGYLAGA